MKKQKVCALLCIAAISMSLATPAIAEDRYSNLNETEIQQKASAQEETMISETEETPGGKVNQPEQELPENIVPDSNNRNPEQQTTEEGTCYVNGKAYLFDQNGAMIKAL